MRWGFAVGINWLGVGLHSVEPFGIINGDDAKLAPLAGLERGPLSGGLPILLLLGVLAEVAVLQVVLLLLGRGGPPLPG